jgi:hypothetical protein
VRQVPPIFFIHIVSAILQSLSHKSPEMKYRDITITVTDQDTKEKVSLTLIGYGISIRRILEFIKERIK